MGQRQSRAEQRRKQERRRRLCCPCLLGGAFTLGLSSSTSASVDTVESHCWKELGRHGMLPERCTIATTVWELTPS